jgi:hypothetical protein
MVPSKKPPGAQEMKTICNAIGTVKNFSGCAKHENETRRPQNRRKRVQERKTWQLDSTPSLQPKMSPGSQNMKIGLGALDTACNGSMSTKHENGTRRPRYLPKRVQERKTCKQDPTPSVPSKMSLGAQNIKTGPDALGTDKNESGCAKHGNGTRRP